MSIAKLKTKFATGAWLPDLKQYFNKINELIDRSNGNGISGDGSYKVYTALLTQSGITFDNTNTTVLQNTLGEIPTLSYDTVGAYLITSPTNIFTLGKTYVILGQGDSANSQAFHYTLDNTYQPNSLYITTYREDTDLAANGMLYNTPIEIRVYN